MKAEISTISSDMDAQANTMIRRRPQTLASFNRSPSFSIFSSARLPKMSTCLLPYIFTFVIILALTSSVQARWCTRLEPYTSVRSYIEQGMCNKSYEEACSFFTYDMCTKYEMVPCMVDRNKTVTLYRIVEKCCPGYKLNPRNNLTCQAINTDTEDSASPVAEKRNHEDLSVEKPSPIPEETIKDARKSYSVNSDDSSGGDDRMAVTVSGVNTNKNTEEKVDKGISSSQISPKSAEDDGHDGKIEYYKQDKKGGFLGLSDGIYAGIICSMVFVLCVIVLVAVRMHKRRRNTTLKQQNQNVEMEEDTQKMMPTDQQRIVPDSNV